MKFNIRDMHDTRTVGVLFGAALLILGALPWMTLTAPFVGTVSVNAWSSDGLIPMLLAVPIVATAWFRRRRVTGWLVVGYIVASLAMFVYDYADVTEGAEGMVHVSPGSGMILSGLLAAAVAVWLLVVEKKFAQAKSFETVVSG